ncbi:hypothetical protein AAZV13_06G113900 [Glycine max]
MRLKHVAHMVPHKRSTPMIQDLTVMGVLNNHMPQCDVNHVRPKIPGYLALIGQIALTNQPGFFFSSNSTFSLRLCKINREGVFGFWLWPTEENTSFCAGQTLVVGESCVCVGQ